MIYKSEILRPDLILKSLIDSSNDFVKNGIGNFSMELKNLIISGLSFGIKKCEKK